MYDADTIKSKYKFDGKNFYMKGIYHITKKKAKERAERLKKKYGVDYRILPTNSKVGKAYSIFTSKNLHKESYKIKI